MNRIGIDLGGTKIEGVLIDDKINVKKRIRIPTNRESGYLSIINRIVSLIEKLKTYSIDEVAIGICTPGAVSPDSGIMKNSNTLCLIGKPLKSDLEDMLKQNIFIENDANCFALAESLIGAGKKYNSIFGVIMGTGVGGGIIINGKIYHGKHFIAGEWGHHSIEKEGRHCYCGNYGCVEAYISGPSLEKRWKELTGETEKMENIIPLYNSTFYRDIFLEWENEFINNFGRSLANIINIFDPEAIILGGGLSNIDFLYTKGLEAVYNFVFSDIISTPILKNKLGDSSGVFGAAMLGNI